jgi:hypothetical protein
MSNIKSENIIPSKLRYKSAPEVDSRVDLSLLNTTKELTEFDRSVNINLAQIYDDERQLSKVFRPVTKFNVVISNVISGKAKYEPFKNSMYYLNALNDTLNQCNSANPSLYAWSGLPQYSEFDFIRNDYNVIGYTTAGGSPTNYHLKFVPQSASTYNWNFFMSYPYENDYGKQLSTIDSDGNTFNWVVSDGIPFIINNLANNGQNIIAFKCPIKHNLITGQFVKLNFSYDGNDTFQVYSLGNGFSGSEEYIFNLLNIGFTGSSFNNGNKGTCKKVVNTYITGDTESKYYVRRHKIITNVNDAVLVRAGYEQNGFNLNRKYETSTLTPNKSARVSIKEGNQSYSLSFNTDISIENLVDNNTRPLSELFFTVIWKGYFGWTLGVVPNNQPGPGNPPYYYGLKQGWDFNLPLQLNGKPQKWWERTNPLSDTGFPVNSYSSPLGGGQGCGGTNAKFCYVESLDKNDIIDGDVCEWNDYEIKEYVISDLYHKFTFNNCLFQLSGTNIKNPFGYYYKPHYGMKIRVFSDYIEEGNQKTTVGIPDYATYSKTSDSFRWKDIYSYGYVDTNGLGVNYPFLNGKHYPYQNNVFKLIPEGSMYINNNVVQDPVIDGCE